MWAAATDYVSWCPLGFDGRPVFALTVGSGSAWRGWVVVPRITFGARGSSAHRQAIDPRRLSPATPFIPQSQAPIAVPRPARRTRDPQSPGSIGRMGTVNRPRAPSRDSFGTITGPRQPIRTPQAVSRHGYLTPEPPATATPPMRAPAVPRFGHRATGSSPAAVSPPTVRRYGSQPQYADTTASPAAPRWRNPGAVPRPAVGPPRPRGRVTRMPGTVPTLPPPAATGVAVSRSGLPQPTPQPTSLRQAGERTSPQNSGRARVSDSRHP